jgi:hypothetical protein
VLAAELAAERDAVANGRFECGAAFRVETKQEGHVRLDVYRYFFGHVHGVLLALVLVGAALTISGDLVVSTGHSVGRGKVTNRCPPPHIVQEEVLQHIVY